MTAYAKTIDPEGFERREKLVNAAKLVQKAWAIHLSTLLVGGTGLVYAWMA